ncbi:MAG: HEAT repeat domain-containing protein [Polyangiaceae bacterium]
MVRVARPLVPARSRAGSLVALRRRGGWLVAALALSFATSAQAFVWPNVPDRIARALESSDASERRTAAQQIRDLPSELAEPLVKKALADEDDQVRIAAASAAVLFHLKGIGDTVIPWLSETDSRLRLAACDVILVSPSPRAVQALGRVLADQSPLVRIGAAHAMGASGSADAVSPLLGHLDDSAPDVRAEVASALGRLGDGRAVLPLVSKIRDAAPEVRRRVARSLGALGDARAVSALILALSDTSTDVRLESIRALGLLGAAAGASSTSGTDGSDEATLALTPLANGSADSLDGAAAPTTESNLAVRQAALEALGRIGSPRAIGVLIAALEGDRIEAFRTPAHDALVAVGERAIKPLVAHLDGSPTPTSAAGAVLALGDLRAADAVVPIIDGLQRNVVPTLAGLRALEKLRDPRSLPAILELIDSPDPKVREASVAAARGVLDPKSPDGRAVEPIQSALQSATDVDERVALVELLGRTGAERVLKTLVELSSTGSTPVRRAALTAIGTLGVPSGEADAALLKALDDEEPRIRADASVALARVGSADIAGDLLKRLVEAAEQDRQALGVALSGVLSRTSSDAIAKAAGAAVTSAPDTHRDALIEGIGRMPAPAAVSVLGEVAKGPPDDRRKVAEVLGGQPKATALLLELTKDADPSVRAAAIWSLGKVGGAGDVAAISGFVSDPDVDVAVNAAGALGRLAPRLGDAAAIESALRAPLCAAISDRRAYVRANALASIRAAIDSGAAFGCDGSALVDVLAQDSSEIVREAAARTLRALQLAAGAAADPSIKAALGRCSSDDLVATVADACDRSPLFKPKSAQRFDLAIFVVPDGKELPVPRAPFTIVLPDGALRAGVSDRRGVAFETGIPDGTVQLGVPAALAP